MIKVKTYIKNHILYHTTLDNILCGKIKYSYYKGNKEETIEKKLYVNYTEEELKNFFNAFNCIYDELGLNAIFMYKDGSWSEFFGEKDAYHINPDIKEFIKTI